MLLGNKRKMLKIFIQFSINHIKIKLNINIDINIR